MTRIRATALIALLPLLLAGCWDLEEVDSRTVILAVAFDAAPGNRLRTLVTIPDPRALVPAGGTVIGPAVEEPAYIVLENEGRTVSDALARIRQMTSREPFFGQVMVVAVSQRLARRGLAPVFDFLMNNTEMSRSAWLVVTAGPPEALTVKPPQETFPEFYVDNAFRARRSPVAIGGLPYWRAWVASLRPGEDAVVPVKEAGQLGQLRLARVAVFRDDQLAGVLSERETRLYALSRGATGSTWEVSLDGRQVAAVRPLHTRFDIQVLPDAGPGRPAFRFQLRLEAALIEAHVDGSPGAGQVARVEERVARDLRSALGQLIQRLQRWKSDPYGFGERYRIAYPERFHAEPWANQWSRARVEISVSVKIRRGGAIQ